MQGKCVVCKRWIEPSDMVVYVGKGMQHFKCPLTKKR